MAKEKEQKNGKGIMLLIAGILIAGGALFIFFLLLFIALIGSLGSMSEVEKNTNGNVALLKIQGTILTETSNDLFGGQQGTSSSYVVKQLENIAEDESIKAIFLEINSPGGSGVASDEITRALQRTNKPSVAYVREVGASGAYWVASGADYIVANPMSLVGSIGVIGSFLDFSEFIESYNVTYQQFTAGQNKDFGSPFRSPTAEERVRYQALLDQLHDRFIAIVAENRDMSIADVTNLADGFVYSGQQALNNGLIDEMGVYEDAISYLETVLDEEVTLRSYEHTPSLFELFTSYKSSSSGSPLMQMFAEIESRPTIIMT